MVSRIYSLFPSFDFFSSQNPIVSEYKHLWDIWWKDSNKETGSQLLAFIQDPEHKEEFEKLAEHARPPYTGAIFSHDYNVALGSLAAWILSGCNPDTKTAVSEFLKYLYQWIDQ